MGKASITDVVNDGWSSDGFGSPADWTTATTGYIALALADAAIWCADRFGVDATAYNAIVATTAVGVLLKRAELLYVSHLFWRRRARYYDSAATVQMVENKYLTVREYNALSEQALIDAEQAISDALAANGEEADTPGSGLAVGYVQGGAFSAVEDIAA